MVSRPARRVRMQRPRVGGDSRRTSRLQRLREAEDAAQERQRAPVLVLLQTDGVMSRKGASPPATTMLSAWTLFTPLAKLFSIARYSTAATG